jgi:O-antigen/teichoic acid export membrane protein
MAAFEPSPREPLTVMRNVSTRYLAIGVEMVVGLGVLPFNIRHLGTAAYGLWMLTGSIVAYFSVLDLGYSGALVKFVAQYRAKRDVRALNEILSTMFFLFTGFGVLTYLAAIALALSLGHLFHLTPEQARVGQVVLLITSVNIALGMAFSVFGGVINGFQRYDLNNIVGAVSSLVVAAVNIAILLAGYGLVAVVVGTTSVRVVTYLVYRANAYRVFPSLELSPKLIRWRRLRKVTSFSVYMALIDWANKLNYSVDALVIGAFLSTNAVAVWVVGQRLAEVTQRFTNQLSEVLFPSIVDHDTANRLDRLQSIFMVSTRLSIALVLAIGGALMLMAGPLVSAWVGPGFEGSVAVVRLLTLTVIVRVACSTSATLLKGAGRHRTVAYANVVSSLANLALSVVLVTRIGLTGVALGTLLPVSAAALLVLFPAGCRRVGVPLRRAIAEAVWPALWPVAIMAAFVVLTRPSVGNSLVAVVCETAAAAGVYALTFVLVSVHAHERRFLFDEMRELAVHWRMPIGSMSEGT